MPLKTVDANGAAVAVPVKDEGLPALPVAAATAADAEPAAAATVTPTPTAVLGKRPLLATMVPHVAVPVEDPERYFLCLYTENTKKKHKTVNDGVLVLKGHRGLLKSIEGKDVCSRLFSPKTSWGYVSG